MRLERVRRVLILGTSHDGHAPAIGQERMNQGPPRSDRPALGGRAGSKMHRDQGNQLLKRPRDVSVRTMAASRVSVVGAPRAFEAGPCRCRCRCLASRRDRCSGPGELKSSGDFQAILVVDVDLYPRIGIRSDSECRQQGQPGVDFVTSRNPGRHVGEQEASPTHRPADSARDPGQSQDQDGEDIASDVDAEIKAPLF